MSRSNFNTDKPKTKISLEFNYEALKQLLGGDTEIEIELRNCIVQEFTRKHLKGIVDDDFKKEINDYLNDKYVGLKQQYREQVQQAIDKEVTANIVKLVKKEKEKILDEVRKALETYQNKVLDGTVNLLYKETGNLSEFLTDLIKEKLTKNEIKEIILKLL